MSFHVETHTPAKIGHFRQLCPMSYRLFHGTKEIRPSIFSTLRDRKPCFFPANM